MKLSEFVLFLLAAAFIQNVVLTTGFGSSVMLRIVRRPRDTFAFGGVLCFFTILTTMLAYPVDLLIRSFSAAKLIRPVIMIAIAAALYVGLSFLLKKTLPSVYQSLSRLLPLAAFNNVVIGVALIVNHQFTLSFWGAVGLALGSCVGFVLLCWLTAEGMERLDNPDMPQAFRGLPATLLYLGILAMALLGFTNAITLI